MAQYFDERNPAVMKGLETLIKAAKAKGKWGDPGCTRGGEDKILRCWWVPNFSSLSPFVIFVGPMCHVPTRMT